MNQKESLQHSIKGIPSPTDINIAYANNDISLFEAINHLSYHNIKSRSEIQKALDLTIDKLKLRLKNENLRYNKDTKRYNKFINGKFILETTGDPLNTTEATPKDTITNPTDTLISLDIDTFLNNLKYEDKKKVSYRLPQSLDSALKIYSALSNTNATDIIIEALKSHIPNHVFELIIKDKSK